MLQLKGIIKNYVSQSETVKALKGIDLQFRRNEFVSILGPSGCGKTTLLNIIGGLDQYTDGDLIINGVSTKLYKDRDWDSYRNHKIGFVFQTYNLIPHQSVLSNVELALTLSGVSKTERRRRAKEALCKVGLGDQLKKKPNQMSGGQMQRVAIARAIVNDPDIILADEPTGALDTETSVQVMEILKEISKDRLVIMVTHNPELADTYSTRIIRMLDGKLQSDSAPLTEDEITAIEKENTENPPKREKMPAMSFATSFMLSLKNLFTKKGRTFLTSFAGSIGIIGIALILSVSEGTTAFINYKQEEALSSYPITLKDTTLDLTSLMETFMKQASDNQDHQNDAVYKKPALVDMVNAMSTLEESENDLKSFNEYLNKKLKNEDSDLAQAVNGILYTYDLELQIYTKGVDGNIVHSDSMEFVEKVMAEYMGFDISTMENVMNSNPMSASMNEMTTVKMWEQLLPGDNGDSVNDLVKEQYDLVYGTWPNDHDEIVLVLDKNNELDDVTLYALGLIPKEDIDALVNASFNGTSIENKELSWSYEDVCNREYKSILSADCYTYDEVTDCYIDLRESDAGLRYLYDNALPLKVTGIIRPDENTSVAMLKGNICYTYKLAEYLIEKAYDTEVIKAQLEAPSTDILTGLPFKSVTGTMTNAEKAQELKDYIATLDINNKAALHVKISSIPTPEFLNEQINAAMAATTRENIETQLSQGMAEQMKMAPDEILEYLASLSDEELNEIYTQILTEQITKQYAAEVEAQMAPLAPEALAGMLDTTISTSTEEQLATYHDSVMTFSESSYEDNLLKMGYLDLEKPASINIYASSFENKDIITDTIAAYNDKVDDAHKIKYTDIMGIMMSSMTIIINAIAYVLIAFVAISLVVSSIMIGVITLISVQERTKEIGILRAIGASKKNVSRMFNAETMIIGFCSGLLGIIVTYLLCIPINAILYALTDIPDLKAILPVNAAVILVIISVLLTLISGIIPSRSAAKKDPVVALRTE